MGASIIAYFPGVTDEQIDLQEGFWNDDNAWANFMVEQEKDPAILEAVKKLNAEAIMTFKTEEMEDEDIDWVTPQQLRDACVGFATRCATGLLKLSLSWLRMRGAQTAMSQ
jgi:hypothetical protein